MLAPEEILYAQNRHDKKMKTKENRRQEVFPTEKMFGEANVRAVIISSADPKFSSDKCSRYVESSAIETSQRGQSLSPKSGRERVLKTHRAALDPRTP